MAGVVMVHPNSAANLESRRNKDQNFYARVASRFNWLKFQVIGAKGNIKASDAFWLATKHKPNWATFSVERQAKITEIHVQVEVVLAELDKLEKLLDELPTTPLRTIEAREAKLKARREARRKLNEDSANSAKTDTAGIS